MASLMRELRSHMLAAQPKLKKNKNKKESETSVGSKTRNMVEKEFGDQATMNSV